MNNEAIDPSWNPNGTNTWAMIECYVTSVVYTAEDGSIVTVTSPDEDPIIGKPLINNPNRAFAKLVDVDPDNQLTSTIYGMDVGVNWDPVRKHQKNAFIGDLVPSVITRDIWFGRQMRTTPPTPFQLPAASQSSSKLENVTWSYVLTSETLKQLKQHSEDNNNMLSFAFSIFNYTRPPTFNLFTLGKIVGTIGVSRSSESLGFPMNRVMQFASDPPVEISDENPCHGASQWMSTTYFDVMENNLVADFGNTLKIQSDGELCQLFPFYVGILTKQTLTSDVESVEIIGEIPYMQPNWYYTTAGIQDFALTAHQSELLIDSKLVVVMLYNPSTGEVSPKFSSHDSYALCESSSTSANINTCVHVILEEDPCYVRPMIYYVFRMEMRDSAMLPMKVRYYGKPVENHIITLIDTSPNSPASPADMNYTKTATSNSYGIAEFSFTAGNIGDPRASFHIDGQIFSFSYCAEVCMDECYRCESPNPGNSLTFLVWSPVQYSRPYFWDTDVQPIFAQYEYINPVMSKILKLGDYDDVTKPHNIRMLNLSMSLSIYHPSFMPVSRDLSPTKIKMILEWLNTPTHPRSWEDIENRLYETPHFCSHTVFAHDLSEPSEFQSMRMESGDESDFEDSHGHLDKPPTLTESEVGRTFRDNAKRRVGSELPLWAQKKCTPDILKKNLQTAISLEFSTIPPYMTALYSIKDGYNKEVYQNIRSVVMQEMLHLAQAANILISIGGQPLIDDPRVIPTSFPATLPGGVLPGLTVTLKKASPMHIASVFMMIEFPDELLDEADYHSLPIDPDMLTIGRFYASVKKCMNKLHKKGKISFGNGEKQLHWPWPIFSRVDELYNVTDIRTARKAIEMIVEHGEGTGQLDPTYLGTNRLAHFYKFEELACKHHLHSSHEHSYSFDGEDIEFVQEGVWPMRDNPTQKGIPVGSQAYWDAKMFHRMYRSLLKSLQEAFDGNPDIIDEAMYIMESMQIQAKKLMQSEIPTPTGHPRQTCGPVFDYEWIEEDSN